MEVLQIMTRVRSVLIALIVLALSAGVVLASQPTAANDGLSKAAIASGQTVPVLNEAPGLAGEDEDTDTDSDSSGPSGNHGADVSTVAQSDCTGGDHDNHGGCVSAVAKDNNGLATATEHGKPSTPGKPSSVPSH
jgi:hypothetical protein